jgi:hypothetical protein
MPGLPWGDDVDRLAALIDGDEADIETLMSEFPGRSYNSVRLKVAEVKKGLGSNPVRVPMRDSNSDHPKPDFGTAPKEPLDVLDFLDRVVTRTDTFDKDDDKDYGRVVIETDRPIAIMKSSDWHFGGLDVDYRALREHVRFLLDVPGMYLQLFGDDLNLMCMHRTVSARQDILTVKEQIAFLESFVHQTVAAGKLISMGWGNHSDEFTERNAGFGIVELIAAKHIPYFRGLGYLDLVLRNSSGEEFTYPMAFAHKVRFHSFMNQLHGNKRMQQLSQEWFPNRLPAKEYITGHTHNPAWSTEGALPHERVHFIKCGAFKTDCLYSQRYFGQGKIGVPTVVYHPDRFQHTVLPTPWEAYRYMTGEDREDAA